MTQEQVQDDAGSFVQQLHNDTPVAWFTALFIVLNLLAWLVSLMFGANWLEPSPKVLVQIGGNIRAATLVEPWRLFTATFLHVGIWHLFLNMWVLFDLGQLTERFYGHRQFALIYIGSGLIGSFTTLYFSPASVVSVGASGAVFGVSGALLAALVTKRRKIPSAILGKLIWSVAAFIVFSLVMGLTQENIDNAAHIGGLLCGFILGTVLAEKFDWQEYKSSRVLRVCISLGLLSLTSWLAWRGL